MTMLRSTSALCSLVVLSTLVILAVPLCSSLPSVARYELRLPLDINKTLMRASRLLLDKFLDKMVGNFLVRRLSEDASDTQVESPSLALSTSTTLSAGSSPSTSVPPTLIEKFDGTSSSTPGVPFPSYIATPRDAAQPPALSTTLLVLLTGGALLFLSIIAVFFYCCVRFRRRRQSQALARKEAALEMGVRQSPGEKKRERWANDSEGGMRKGHGYASPSAFEFSPPSPTWRPTLPSLVFVSGNGGGDRAPISNAEMIMREREHGRRNGGGGGWLYGSCATGSGEPSHCSYASTPRRIAGVNTAPPLPAPAPRACHPPVYHRPSRIAPASHGASHAIPSSTLGRANSTTRSVHFAPPLAAPRALAVTVPHIQVYPAQDGPAPSIQLPMQTHTAAHGVRSTASKTVGNPKTGNTGVGIKRTDCQRSGRPVSGLGISAIDVALNGANSAFSSIRVNTSLPYISAQPSAVARKSLVACPFEPSPRDLSGNQQRLDGGTSNVVPPCPSSPASDEDVRLAYTVSASSIRSATNSESAARTSKIRVNEIVTAITKNENDGPLRTLAAQKSNAEVIAEMTSSKATPSINKDTSRLLVAGTNSFSQVSAFPSEARGGTASLARSSSSECVSTSRRQGLGASTVDESAKGELHAMCSLGSESFDSLIAYLEDTVEPGDERKRNTVRVTSRQKQTSADPGERKDDQTGDRMESTRVTREDTARVDKDAYEAWVGSLNASPSILRLAHVEVSSGAVNENRTSGRAGRRSRSISTSGTRTGAVEAGPRVILRECDTNRDSRKMHAPNEKGKVSHDARASVRGKVGIQVRALRARSASLKQNQVRGNSESALENVPVDATRSGTSGVKVAAARPLSVKNLPQMEKEHQQLSSLPLATKSSLPLTALPSLSMLSSSTQLYAMFPSSEASSTSPSAPSIKVSNNTRRSQASAHIPTTSSSSNSVSVSTAASIVRCAQTPHAKTSAVLPFLSPSPTSVHRLSAGSMSSSESNTSTWGRRSEWGRESLTPRFDHLRAVLEGRSEDPPPLPTKSELHGERAVLDFADSFPLRLRI